MKALMAVIFTTLLMLGSAAVAPAETDEINYIGPPPVEDQADSQELIGPPPAYDGGDDVNCLSCG